MDQFIDATTSSLQSPVTFVYNEPKGVVIVQNVWGYLQGVPADFNSVIFPVKILNRESEIDLACWPDLSCTGTDVPPGIHVSHWILLVQPK